MSKPSSSARIAAARRSRQAPCCGWSWAAIRIGRTGNRSSRRGRPAGRRMTDILNLDRRARSSDDLRVFTVGAFGRLAGVSAKVLRTYDAAGLFRPAWVDPASGYRYYSPAQLPSLRRLLALRELGLGRADLVEAIRGEVDLRAALERRRAALESERVAIERRLAMLEIRVGQPEESDVVVRRLDPEPIAAFDVRDAPGDDIGAAFHELEAHIRDLGIRAPRPPGAIPDENLIY